MAPHMLWIERTGVCSHLRQLQGSHDRSESEHVAHVALEFSSQLDGFMQEGGSLLCAARTTQQIHRHHYRHGVKPVEQETMLITQIYSTQLLKEVSSAVT